MYVCMYVCMCMCVYVCMYWCMYVCVCVCVECVCERSETYSVLESVVTVMIVVNTCVTDLFMLISGNCSDNLWSPDRYCTHEFSVIAHWFLLNPSARRPSLRAGLVKVFNQLVYYGLLVSQRCSQNRWWPPLILLLLNKAQTDKWRLRAGARGIISRGQLASRSYKQQWHIGTQWFICFLG
jgi:hypothetical protein